MDLLVHFLSPPLNILASVVILFFFSLSVWGSVKPETNDFLRKIAGSGAGLLTTTGILFTFVGITMGLYGFKLDDINNSIPKLLEGMNTAFFSSVLGVGSAIVFKFIQSAQKTTRSGASADSNSESIYREREHRRKISVSGGLTHWGCGGTSPPTKSPALAVRTKCA